MSRFCGGNGSVPSLSMDELRAPFADGILPSSLPQLQNGLASDDWVMQYVQQLDASGRLPKPAEMQKIQSNMFGAPEEKDPLEELFNDGDEMVKAWVLRAQLGEDFVFYERLNEMRSMRGVQALLPAVPIVY